MVDFNDGKIHGWNGGQCPVHPKTEVKVWLRDGPYSTNRSSSYRWVHSFTGSDIIALAVVKEYKEPCTLWVNEYSDAQKRAHASKEAAIRNAGIEAIRVAVKYQEVTDADV